VLIVDDSEIDRYILNRKLSRLGQDAIDVVEQQDGDEALNYLSECLDNDSNIPEVIFLDVNMPKMGGFEFLAKFAPLCQDSLLSKSKVMMYSSSDRGEDKQRAFGFPCVKDFLIKGELSVDELERKMTHLLKAS
jgi:CheY-like chemotaxis protein